MYLGKREIANVKGYEERREKCVKYKLDATVTAFSELENKSQITKQYFGKSQSWFSQRLNGCTVLNKAIAFKDEEFLNWQRLFVILPNAWKHMQMRLIMQSMNKLKQST